MGRAFRITAYVALGLAMIGLVVFAAVVDTERRALQNQLSNADGASFYDFLDSFSEVNTSLSKLSMGYGSEMGEKLLAEVWKDSEKAVIRLSEMNMGQEAKQKLTGFINTIYDYTGYLLFGGKTEEAKDHLSKLKDNCTKLYECVRNAWEGGYDPTEEIDAFLQGNEVDGAVDFATHEYPELIYDGAFSETEQTVPENLCLEKVTKEKAKEAADQFLKTQTEYLSYTEGKQPFFTFVKDETEVYVAEHGGLLLGFEKRTEGGLEMLATEEKEREFIDKAAAYLKELGFGECESGYVQYYNGSALINMIPVVNGARVYPDLIKVKIGIETKEVVALDLNSYVSAHKERTFPEGMVSMEEASAKMEGREVKMSALAVIPKDDGSEALAYEFWCPNGEEEYIVYLDAYTLETEDILQVIHVNNGTLTK